MPKRKSNTEINVTTNKKSLKDITGIDKDLGLKMTADKASQTEEIEIVEEDFFKLIANDLESSDIITESVDGDQTDGFRETIKLLVEKLFEQIKHSIKNDAATPDNKKQKFIKALIRIFSIFLNANLSSAKKITKIIKQSAKLVINLWPGQKSLLDGTTDQRPQGGPNIRELRARGKPWKRKLTDAIAKSNQIEIVNRTKRKQTEKPKFKVKTLLLEPKTVQIKKDGQTVKTINVNRKSHDFDGIKVRRY